MIWIGGALAASVTLNPGDDVASLTSSLGPGDEVVFNAGTYELSSSLYWADIEGTEADPVVVRGEGEAVIKLVESGSRILEVDRASWLEISNLTFTADGEGWEEWSTTALNLEDTSNLVIEDCTFEHLDAHAIVLAGDTTGAVIRGNDITDINGHGLYAGCSDVSCWLQGSTIEQNWFHGLNWDSSWAIYLEHGAQDNVIRDNVMYDLGYRGVHLGSTELGPPNVFEGNAIWGVESIALYVAGSSVVRNNLVFNTGERGIYTGDSSDRGTFTELVISHNTIVDTGWWGIYLEHWAEGEGMVLANNVISNPTGYALTTEEEEGDISEANYIQANVVTGLVWGEFDELAGHFQAGFGSQDFVDAPGWNFYPADGSSLVGQADPSGSAWVPEVDFNDYPRDGASPDVGAYERSGGENPGWAIQEGFKVPGYDDSGETQQVGGCCNEGDGEPAAAFLLLPLLGLVVRRR